VATIEYPVTPAIRVLRSEKVQFTPHLYRYEEHGGTAHSAEALGVPEHSVVKTLIMENDAGKVLIVLMHGDCEVSTKNLARVLGVRSIQPCDAAKAQKTTGYLFGGTSPFGTRSPLPVYAEKTIFNLETIYLNGGKRGFLVGISPSDLKRVLKAQEVEVALPKGSTG
jgi:Cys-tRNA(Pro) deacylase